MAPPKKRSGVKPTTTTTKVTTTKGAKQQTIVDSMKTSALKRKDKPTTKSRQEDDAGGPEDEEENKRPVATKRTSRLQAVGNNQKKKSMGARVVDESDSDQEEKSEERGPQKHRTSTNVAAKPRRSEGHADVNHVLTGSFLLSAGNSSDLSRRLKQTWTVLQDIPNQHEDGVPLEKLRLLCSELLHDKIMEHTEKNVRSLASCCFVELLRVYAPEMPFKSNEELYDAFQLILEQLRCLAMEGDDEKRSNGVASSTNLHHLYVLESLASCKSYLLLVGMDYVADESDEPLLVQLFRTMFNTICKEHSVKIENLMLSIMTTCVEESDTIEQNFLDAILSPLVHSNPHVETSVAVDPTTSADSTNHAERGPYLLAQELIRRTSDHLQSHLSHFFNSVLVDAPNTFTSKASELKEHVYTLIYEVHKINSSLLLYVLPNVCMQLQVDEVATRSEAIALMGRLFASSHAEYGQDYMKNFRDFLGRFRDVSKEIRLQMVQVSAIIWQRKPELASLIEKEFVSRLADPEWEVRRLVVNEACDLAANNIDAVTEDCLRQVGERMKDKRVILRKESMTGLSQVYAAHVSAYWGPEDDEDEEDSDISLGNVVRTSNVKKLGWVPDFVLKCFAYPQQELKLRVIQLLDDILLPKALSETCRAKGLLFIYHSLDSTAREALRRVFVERAKCQTHLESFLSAKKMSRRASTSPSQAVVLLDSAKTNLRAGIAPLFTETDNLAKLLDQLASWKDQTVFKQLEILCDCSSSQQDYRSARDRLVKAVGSKSPLGDFLKNFCRKLNLLTVSEGTIATYLRFFSGTRLQHHRENRSVTDLLLIVARTTPQLFGSFVQKEFESIMTEHDDKDAANDTVDDEEEDENERDDKVIVSLLSALALFAEYWKNRQLSSDDLVDRQATDAVPSDALKSYLKQCCLGVALKNTNAQDDGAAAKFAAQILANFFGESKDVGGLVSKLCSKKFLVSASASSTLSTLNSLHVFAKRCPMHFSKHPDMISFLWQALLENYIYQDKQDSKGEATRPKKASRTGYTNAKAADVRCLAIKVAADLLLHCHDGDAGNLRLRSRELLDLLFDLLRSDGRKWASTGSLPAKYRVSAASNILKLLRHRAIESSLTVAEWHILGFVLQDSAEDVRKAFAKKLSANLMKSSIPHPHKYLSYLVLAATEHNAVLKKSARGLLTVAVERMRRTFEATSSRATATNGGDGDDEERQNVNALMVPEYALPYVIHLLAHHPDFPSSAAAKYVAGSLRGSLVSDPSWNDQVAYLDFFIDGLMPANTAEADNISFLLQILTKLSDCHDSSDPSGVAIYPLIECAVMLLKRRIKNQSNLKAFPGKIYLPKHLYGAGKAAERRLSVDSSRSVDKSDEESAETKLASQPPSKKARMSASLSPIKPSGTLTTFLNMSSPPLSAQKRRTSTSSTTRRKSLVKSPATPTVQHTPASGDEVSSTPTPRRQSLMRKARSQVKTFVADSESEDDSDSFVTRPSVASRVSPRVPVPSKSPVKEGSDDSGEDTDKTPRRDSPPKRRRSTSATPDEETKGESDAEGADEDDEEMTSFRPSRRQRRS